MTGSNGRISITLGEQQHSKAFDPQCAACRHPLMVMIDGLIAHGWSYSRISEFTARSARPPLTAQQLSGHLPHLAPVQEQERRALDEAAAARAGAPDAASLITSQDLVRVAVQRAYERIADGAEVQVRDVTALLRLQQQMEASAAADDAAAGGARWEAAFRELMWILRRHLRGAAWGAFMADLKGSETLNSIMPREGAAGEEKSEPAARR